MFHDLAAEMAGYRAELLAAQRAGKTEREDAVRAEIERVGRAIAAQARQYETEAQMHDNSNQHVLAAQARAHASNLTGVLREAGIDTAVEPERAVNPPAVENAADSTPKQTAVTRRGRTSKES